MQHRASCGISHVLIAKSCSAHSRELNGVFAYNFNATSRVLQYQSRPTMKLNAKDNSLGLLLNDTLLYNNLNETVVNASNLLIDLKQNPKRYVRFSLF